MVFIGKIRWNNDLYNNLFDKGFPVRCFAILKSLDKGYIFNRNLTPLAKTEDIDTGACSNRGKKMVERGGG
jgi:hypothetical protein